MASSQDTQPQHPFLSIHSTDEHQTIYSFPNTTSYSTLYTFFSSFRITLWPMWLANSKRQPCFHPPQSHAQEDTQNWQKVWQTWWENCAVPQNIQFSFMEQFFYTVKLHSLTLSDPIMMFLFPTLSLIFNLFQSNYSANRILPSSYLFWAGKRVVGYL
jgi:hypothetical protein